MCTALTHVTASKGLETSSWQTKDNVAAYSWIRLPARKYLPVHWVPASPRSLYMEAILEDSNAPGRGMLVMIMKYYLGVHCRKIHHIDHELDKFALSFYLSIILLCFLFICYSLCIFVVFILAAVNGHRLCVARLLKTPVWKDLLIASVSGIWRKMVRICQYQIYLLMLSLDWQAGMLFYSYRSTWSPTYLLCQCWLSLCQRVCWSTFTICYLCCSMPSVHMPSVHMPSIPSVLWHCWLGGRKGIRPVKNWVVGCWRGYLSGVRCRLACGPVDDTATDCLLLQ